MAEQRIRKKPLPRVADLRGVAQLATAATVGAAHISEGVHQSVLGTLGIGGSRRAGRSSGLTGLIYSAVRGTARGVGKVTDLALQRLQPLLEDTAAEPSETPRREALLAALNGVIGDRLAAMDSPLATPMSLRRQGRALDAAALAAQASPPRKLLLLIHGLCMNDLHWSATQGEQTVNHGAALAAALGAELIYLRYNTGRHIGDNGRELSALLERLVAQLPGTPPRITVLAHSMGGLVVRSAAAQAQRDGQRWPERLEHIVFLGTPHLGAPLERAGHWVDVLLAGTPYSAPFVALTKARSAGITDLRHGRLFNEGAHAQVQAPTPLPPGVKCFAIAASTAARENPLAERLLGDGLVPVDSALGRQRDPRRSLAFADDAQCVLYRMGHLDLLARPEVTRQLLQWLVPVDA